MGLGAKVLIFFSDIFKMPNKTVGIILCMSNFKKYRNTKINGGHLQSQTVSWPVSKAVPTSLARLNSWSLV